MDKQLTLPTLHLNGTGYRMLMEGYSDARQAVLKTVEAVSKIEFNARDYYPQGDEAWRKASDEMKARYAALQGVADEFLAIMESIQDQQDARTRS